MASDHKNEVLSIPYTEKQGQYLAFIYYYTKINGLPPSERDMQKYFKVSAPSVHGMIIELEKKKLSIERKEKAKKFDG